MIQFLGLAFNSESVDVVYLGRDLTVTHRRSTPIANVSESGNGATTIPAAEWVRAASYLVRDSFLDLETKKRKIWGMAIAAPPGWVAISRDLSALSDVHLTPGEIGSSMRSWIQEDDRRKVQIEAVLSPKDYFRFAVSGALACDFTTAARTELVRDDSMEWSAELISAAGLERRCFAPIFESSARTGQLGDQGMESLAVQARLWLVAGAETSACAQLSCGDPRGHVWASSGHRLLRYDAHSSSRPSDVEGFRVGRSIMDGAWSLERPWDGESTTLESAVRDLQNAGREVGDTRRDDGEAALGAALLAAQSSQMVKGWDRIFRQLAR